MADNPRLDDLKRRVQLDPTSIAFAALAEEFRRAGRFEEGWRPARPACSGTRRISLRE